MDTVSLTQRKHPRRSCIIFIKSVKRGHDDTIMQEFLERYETDGYVYQSLQFHHDGKIPYSFIFTKERTDKQIAEEESIALQIGTVFEKSYTGRVSSEFPPGKKVRH